MPKVKISEYSSTANSNTDVASINIDENCSPSGINNAIRAVMGHLKDFQTGAVSDPLTVGGAFTTSSTVTHNGGTANSVAYLNGSKVLTTGSALVFDGSKLGVGVTPSAWSGFKAIDLQGGGAIASYTSSPSIQAVNNAYFDGTNWRYKTSTYASRYLQDSGTHQWTIAASGTAGNAITFTQAMTLDASGNLGVGTTSPNVAGGTRAITLDAPTAGNYSGFELMTGGTLRAKFIGNSSQTYFGTETATPLVLVTGGAERARIDSSGNLLVGKTALNATVLGSELRNTGRVVSTMAASTNADDSYELYSTGASTYRFYVGLGGTVYATNTTISSLSDIRFKENVRDLDAGLTEIMALKPRLYDWKEGKGADIKNARGFIAQEFEEVFPDLIDTWKETPPEGEDPYKSVRADLIPVLVKAIQEQQAIITQLTTRITALEGN